MGPFRGRGRGRHAGGRDERDAGSGAPPPRRHQKRWWLVLRPRRRHRCTSVYCNHHLFPDKNEPQVSSRFTHARAFGSSVAVRSRAHIRPRGGRGPSSPLYSIFHNCDSATARKLKYQEVTALQRPPESRCTTIRARPFPETPPPQTATGCARSCRSMGRVARTLHD